MKKRKQTLSIYKLIKLENLHRISFYSQLHRHLYFYMSATFIIEKQRKIKINIAMLSYVIMEYETSTHNGVNFLSSMRDITASS